MWLYFELSQWHILINVFSILLLVYVTSIIVHNIKLRDIFFIICIQCCNDRSKDINNYQIISELSGLLYYFPLEHMRQTITLWCLCLNEVAAASQYTHISTIQSLSPTSKPRQAEHKENGLFYDSIWQPATCWWHHLHNILEDAVRIIPSWSSLMWRKWCHLFSMFTGYNHSMNITFM